MTFCAKEYPRELNAAMAYCLLRRAKRATAADRLPEWYAVAAEFEQVSASVTMNGQQILADFQL
eukprot:Skav227745  [mRNA]  locus=scaffold3513:271059:271250:- [translate_table: standard]